MKNLMFAKTATWDSYPESDLEVGVVNTDQVSRLVSALDGKVHTLVTLHGPDRYLTIGGDFVSGLVVYASMEEDKFLVAGRKGSAADEPVTVVAGGQPGVYPAVNLISGDQAVAIAATFARDGTLSGVVDWSSTR